MDKGQLVSEKIQWGGGWGGGAAGGGGRGGVDGDADGAKGWDITGRARKITSNPRKN